MTKEETLQTLRTMSSVGSISLSLDSVIELIEKLDLNEVVQDNELVKGLIIEQLIEEIDDSNIGDEISCSFSRQVMDYVYDFEVSMNYNKTIELDGIEIDESKFSELIEDGVRKWLSDKLS